MSPRSVVQPIVGERKGEAGVVERVSKEKDAEGNPKTLAVRMDVDGALVEFNSQDVKVLAAH